MQSATQANILLVDDRTENLLALEAVLADLGQNLVKARSGEEALRCLLNQDFAVILLDVQMPGVDGFETASLIRQRTRSRQTPIIFLTAFSTNDAFITQGYAMGAVDYLFKPLDPVILKSKVSVFVDLFQKNAEVKQQAAQLAAVNAELRQSEERFRSLSACSPVGIFLMDITGKCTYTNPRSQAICGFTLEESLGEGWQRFVHPDDRERAIADWQSYTHKRQETSFEYRFQTPEGTVRWAHVRTSPMFSDDGELVGHVGTIEDMTARKQAEAVREQFLREQAARQQAESANRMKDEFLAIVSHELRTPLNSILGWSRLLLMKPLDAAATTRALEIIERNARAQAQLVADILDVSQIIRGRLRISKQPIDLMVLTNVVLEMLRPLADTKNIVIETNFDPNARMVLGDADRLRQVIGNLLSNAIKFTPEAGQVTIRLNKLDRSSQEPSKSVMTYAELQVIDTGVGINPDFLPYVFDRFRQEDTTSTRSHGGLGLGLAIAHHLVQLHGGEIHAASEGEGKGATFTIQLPLALVPEVKLNGHSDHPTAPTEIHLREPALHHLHILLVEDNPDTRDFVVMILEEAGATVTAVGTASEAMACCQKVPPHLLISDIGLPQEDGYQLIRQVREMEKQQGWHIPAIALTAYARREDQLQALAAGFQMHLAKPIDPDQLLAVAANVVRVPGEDIPENLRNLKNAMNEAKTIGTGL